MNNLLPVPYAIVKKISLDFFRSIFSFINLEKLVTALAS